MEYQPLDTLLQALTADNQIHICVQDLSGILQLPGLTLPFSRQIHSRPFCDAAKSTPAGRRLCLWCKLLTNQKTAREKQPFSGLCPYGLYELVYPVRMQDSTCCILYIGNIVTDPSTAKQRMNKAARLTGVERNALEQALSSTHRLSDPRRCLTLAKLVESYLLLVSRTAGFKPKASCHWAVASIRRDLEAHYASPLTLGGMAKLYFLNEKYIGRLFKQQTGCTFHAYLNRIRLEHAARLLRETDRTVTAVALDCGFETVTYFNRLFRQHYGQTPSAYRG